MVFLVVVCCVFLLLQRAHERRARGAAYFPAPAPPSPSPLRKDSEYIGISTIDSPVPDPSNASYSRSYSLQNRY